MHIAYYSAVFLFISVINLFGDDNQNPNNQNTQVTYKIEFSLSAIPFVGVQTPKNQSSFVEKQITPDIKNGSGFGAYLGFDIIDNFDSENFHLGFGLVYQRSLHESELDLYELTVNIYEFEVNANNSFINHENFRIIQQYGLGVGLSEFEYDKNRKDFQSGVATFRYILNFEFYNHFDLHVGGGFFVWGEPGETLAYGGFIFLGAGCRF